MRTLTAIVLATIILAPAALAIQPDSTGTDVEPIRPGVDVAQPAMDQAKLVEFCKNAPIVFLAKVKAIEFGQTNSMPPHRFSAITLQDPTMLKGEQPKSLGFSYNNIPGSAGVSKGSSVIIAVKETTLICIAPATDENLAAVKKAITTPATAPAKQ